MSMTKKKPWLRIGELAAQADLNPKTIRYYEKIGLLPAPQRSPAGYRLYDPAECERLEFILRAKAIGLTLEEIGEILTVRGRGEPPCERVLALLDDKIDAVNQQVQALSAFGQELVALREEAEEVMQANGGICRIIEHYTPAPSNQAIRAKARALRPLGGR